MTQRINPSQTPTGWDLVTEISGASVTANQLLNLPLSKQYANYEIHARYRNETNNSAGITINGNRGSVYRRRCARIEGTAWTTVLTDFTFIQAVYGSGESSFIVSLKQRGAGWTPYLLLGGMSETNSGNMGGGMYMNSLPISTLEFVTDAGTATNISIRVYGWN